MSKKKTKTKAFLKWAGGKSQSIERINYHLTGFPVRPLDENKFIEPFVGSGVVFMNVQADGYIISDVNEDLTNIYKLLKEDKGLVISTTKEYFRKENNTEEEYYKLREKFNATDIKDEALVRAALFIYLNRHGFNGLCRYNRSGKFNVPFGKYDGVYFPERELSTAAKKLERATIFTQGFEDTIKLAEPNDVIYCDPPYVPLSATASFTDYSTDGFDMSQQELLAKLAEETNCRFLISNHDNEVTRELYKNADEIVEQEVSRFISADGKTRKPVTELLAIYNRKD